MEKDKLTPQQKQAVEYIKTPLIIVAGAGSGKTKVLTSKAIYLMDQQKYSPSEILLTTFTVKAAEEMRKRIETSSKKDISPMFIGTIHSLCENIIKENGGKDVYTGFEVLDEFKRYLFIKRNLKKLNLNIIRLKKLKGIRQDNEIISLIEEFYDTITENLIDTKKLKESILNETKEKIIESILVYNENKKREIDPSEIRETVTNLIDSYSLYQNLLSKNKFLDFSHLELIAYTIMTGAPAVLQSLQKQYRYVLIDEFQDINPLQWKILSAIATHKNIACVGDKNQSIYGFRGSNPNIFDHFKDFYKDAKEIKLEDNFRSRKDIIDVANNFLEKRRRVNLKLNPKRKERCKVYYINSKDEAGSSKEILSMIVKLKQSKKIKNYGDVAILFRSLKYHGKSFIKLLDTEFKNIPYTTYGGTNFLENEEIRAMLFLLSYVYGFDNSEESLGLTDFSEIKGIFSTNLMNFKKMEDIYDLKQSYDESKLIKQGFGKREAEIIISLNKLREKIFEFHNFKIESAFYEITGILDIIKKEDDKENLKILYDLGKLSELIVHFSNFYDDSDMSVFINVLNELPETVNLNKKSDEVEVINNDSLYLMNIHQAKGLEFPIVIIPSLIKRRVPNTKKSKPLLEIPKKFYLYEPYDPLKEEENLFYVAITRSRDWLILSDFNEYDSGIKAGPSEFIDEVRQKIYACSEENFKNIEISKRDENELDIKLIDYSAISAFLDCQERFKINYLYGFKAQQIFQQKIGLIYHNCIAKINQAISNGEKINDLALSKIIEDSWIDLASKNEIFRKKIFYGLKRYIGFMDKELHKVVGIEKPLSVIKDNIRIRGRADLIYEDKDHKKVLMDFKARKLGSIDETHVDYQLNFYNDALKNQNHIMDKAIAYPIEEENLKINKATINIKSNKDIHNLLNKFSNSIKTKKFEGTKKGSQFCKECPYKPMCKHNKCKMRK